MADVFLKFRYVEGDVVNALRLQLKARGVRGLRVAAAFVCLLAAVVGWPLARRGAWTTLGFFAVGLVTVLSMFAAGVFVVLPRMFFRSRADLRGPMGVDVSDEGIGVTAGVNATSIPWSDVARVDADARILAIHHATRVLLIPRRVFRSEQQHRSFFDLFERHQASRENRRAESGKSTPSAAP